MVVLLMEARWLIFAALSVCLILILATYSKADPGWSQSSVVPKIHNLGGKFGAWLADVVLYVFGFSAWWWSVVCLRQVVKSYRRLADRLSMQVETKTGEEEGLPYLLARITGFALLICGSMGLEFLRMHTLSLPLPLAPGAYLAM
jgi:S-DNA-T family DNA segregation ATPase FtsK/SpoIIIE